MKKTGAFRATFILFGCIILSAVVLTRPAGAETTSEMKTRLGDLKDELSELSNEKSELQDKYEDILAQKEDIIAKKSNLDAQLEVIGKQVDSLDELIAAYDEKIAASEVDIAALQTQEDELYAKFKTRVRVLYEEGSASYIGMIFTADSLDELLTRADFVSSILERDRELMQELTDKRAELESAKAELTSERSENDDNRAELVARETELNELYENSNAMMAELEDAESANRAELTDVLDREDELAADIASLAKKIASSTAKYSGGSMQWPLPGHTYISSEFGYRIHPILGTRRFHSGVDIPAPKGTSILSANSGNVIAKEYSSVNGNYVMIDHGGGIVTMYAHMTSSCVSVGESVSKGQTIGYVGSTGWSTGAHLHFEIIKNGSQVNPLSYFN